MIEGARAKEYEVNFMVDTQNKIIPLEVKAAVHLKEKSLKTYYRIIKPDLCVRTSMADYKMEERI